MQEIAITKPDGKSFYSRKEFVDSLLQICEEHQTEGRALAFAFIVYDFYTDVGIKKVLGDPDCLDAFDSILGSMLTIFYIHRGSHKVKPSYNPDYTYMMVELSSSQDILETIGRVEWQKSTFEEGQEKKINAPCVVFFQVMEREIVDLFIVELEKERQEDSFLELKKLMLQAVETVKDVEKSYSENYQEIFELVKTLADQRMRVRLAKKAKSTGKAIVGIVELYALFKVFVG